MEKYNFDVETQTLTITAKFAEAMNNPQSREYKFVIQLQNDFPGLTISKRTHKSATKYKTKSGEIFKCNQFKNLTYDRIETFLSALPKSEAYLREYKYLKEHASAVQHNRYTVVRRWFVAQFPEFRKNPLYYLNNSPALISGSNFLIDNAA